MKSKIKPGLKKIFYGVTGTLFIVTMANYVASGVSLATILLHNTLIFVVLLAFLYNVYIRQEFIYSKLK